MRRVIPLISVCLLLTAAAEPAFAQQRLFAVMQQEVVEVDPRPASLGTVIRRLPIASPPSDSSKNVVSFGGGEFLAWTTQSGGGAVVLLSTRNGAVQRFTFPGFTPRQVIGTDGNTRLLVLGANASGDDVVLVADAHSASVRFLDVGRINFFSPAITYAPASDVLFVAKPRGPGPDPYHDVDVIQASTGALLDTLDIWPVSADVLSTNAAGTRLFVTDALNGTFAFDLPSGTQIASNTSALALQSTLRTATIDEHRNRLLVSIEPALVGFGDSVGISAFSADSLQSIGRVRVPELPLPPPTPDSSAGLTGEIDFSGLSATVFVLQAAQVTYKYNYRPSICNESQLIALDVDTGQVRRTVNTTAALGAGACDADLVRVTEPAPPPALTADVAGYQVMLKWQAPFGATQYEIEAGSAPGLANLATVRVTDPQLVIDGVPTGAYYLRVRAINTIGKSGASQEVQVIVP